MRTSAAIRTVDKMKRVVIPARMCRDMNIGYGTEFEVIPMGNDILLKRYDERPVNTTDLIVQAERVKNDEIVKGFFFRTGGRGFVAVNDGMGATYEVKLNTLKYAKPEQEE